MGGGGGGADHWAVVNPRKHSMMTMALRTDVGIRLVVY